MNYLSLSYVQILRDGIFQKIITLLVGDETYEKRQKKMISDRKIGNIYNSRAKLVRPTWGAFYRFSQG